MKQSVLLPTGSNARHSADLSQPCITTTDFLTPRIIYTHEVVPGENWRAKVDGMTRCLPMYKPAYAEMRNNIRAFFVPMRVLFYRWSTFITNSKDGSASAGSVFFTTPWDLIMACSKWNIFSRPSSSVYWSVFADNSEATRPDNFDISFKTLQDYKGISPTPLPEGASYFENYVRFGKEGKFIWSLLQGLGYDIKTAYAHALDDYDVYDPTSALPNTPYEHLSCMPILAYAKIVLDYYCNPRDTTHYTSLHSILNDFFTGSVFQLNSNGLQTIYRCVSELSYGVDYFTSAWEDPTSPSNMFSQSLSFRDPTLIKEGYGMFLRAELANNPSATSCVDGGPLINMDSNNPPEGARMPILTQYLDTALHKLADIGRKMNIVGLRPLDRFFTSRGIKMRSEYLNRSVYIGHSSSPFQISDVTSTGSLEDLADYKGKAMNYNIGGSFDYDAGEDFGYIIMVSTITPSIRYFQGTPRYINHLLRNDFYQEEFDKLGVQAIRASELKSDIVDINTSSNEENNINDDEIIGYTDRYAEYKQNCYGKLLGDFKLRGHNGTATGGIGMTCWHLWRNIASRSMLNASFRSASDRNQYDRVFEITDSQEDGFIQLFNIDVKSSLPMSAMFDSYEWSDDVGKPVKQQINGTYVD